MTGLARAAREVWRPALLWFALLVAVSPKVGPLPVALGATGVLVLARTRDRQAWELVRFIACFVAFAAFRNLADDLGFPVRYGYVVGWESFLFGGIPSQFLQSVRTPITDWVAILTYFSYFLVPPRPSHGGRFGPGSL